MIEFRAPVKRSGGCYIRPGMSSEHVEHSALVVRREVKETVPSEYAIELAGQLKLPHVFHHPFMIGETLTT